MGHHFHRLLLVTKASLEPTEGESDSSNLCPQPLDEGEQGNTVWATTDTVVAIFRK